MPIRIDEHGDFVDDEVYPCRRYVDKPSSRVACVETGAVYQSVARAASATGANRTQVYECLDNPGRTAGGYHWRRA